MNDGLIDSDNPQPALLDDAAGATGGPAEAYRVLARKYRPKNFAELMGQDALVRTLTNAINAGRVHHAYLLTGVRGVGKTTTARVIARALNCVGAGGTGGPTAEPCGVCEHCVAIAEDRHVDVMEMDAASRTGVDDIREILDGVRYRPVTARTKVYIIDEVHMLSRNAFNALLKTLEEPPEHVVFVFATTEIRKVPITVVSRCMRFDLRRIDEAVIASYLAEICRAERREAEPAALAMLARAGDGSMRDALSLLDQALATSGEQALDAGGVRAMLGLADRGQVVDLFARLMDGEPAQALALFQEMYRDGADPLAVNQDLLEVAHWLTRLRVAPDDSDDAAMTEEARARGRTLAARLTVPGLTRAWQILLKGIAEVQAAPNARAAFDMILIRLAYVRDLPDPGALAALIAGEGGAAAVPAPRPAASPAATGPAATDAAPPMADPSVSAPPEAETPAPDPATGSLPASFDEVVALVLDRREGVLHAHLKAHAHLVRFRPGHIELRLDPEAPADLAPRLSQLLTRWTGRRWLVGMSQDAGAPTLRQQEEARSDARLRRAAEHPLVRAALDAFPGATITAVRDRIADAPETPAGDEADPFAESDQAINDEG
ncbi:MAG: DNA polymerase III subunit gamma/tau [Alphaproteobacteria bacterium]